MTALYEIVPVGGPGTAGPLRYAPAKAATPGAGEYGFVKIRYKLPKSEKSQLLSAPIDRTRDVARFAARRAMPGLRPVSPHSPICCAGGNVAA